MSKGFAFYGRVSTEDQQDPESSKQWQQARSRSLIEPHGGQIVEDFFDVGLSRSLPWKRRPRAAALLESFKDPGRGFDAVVVGEPARAFYGNQFGLTFPVFVHYGIQLWVPEVGGQVDPGSDAHDLVMALYGGMSKGERNRIKIRVRAAMAAQASSQGRYLGGRPPYGYRLADAGPHPNPGKAAAGQRAHRLDVDPRAAAIVRRIFSEFVGGRGVTAIANRLNAEAIACPAAHDPDRNRHRSGAAWVGSAVLAILKNPRYTGYEVWNKQRKDEVLINVDDVALGHETRQRWNPQAAWIFSTNRVHEPLITSELFQQAQTVIVAAARPKEPRGPRPAASRTYLLSGLIFCSACGRRMAGSWNNGRAHYRCNLKTADTQLARSGHAQAIYVREDKIVDRLDRWLGDLFTPTRKDATIDLLHQAGQDPHTQARRQAVTTSLRSCDERLAKYRAALEAGVDLDTVSTWIAEVKAERTRHEIDLARLNGQTRLTRDQIASLVEHMAHLTTVLHQADPRDRAEVYNQLGLKLTYQNDKRLILVETRPDQACIKLGVRGATLTTRT
jgi:site-specific DNA recombinase